MNLSKSKKYNYLRKTKKKNKKGGSGRDNVKSSSGLLQYSLMNLQREIERQSHVQPCAEPVNVNDPVTFKMASAEEQQRHPGPRDPIEAVFRCEQQAGCRGAFRRNVGRLALLRSRALGG